MIIGTVPLITEDGTLVAAINEDAAIHDHALKVAEALSIISDYLRTNKH